MSKRLGGIIGCKYKTSSWHLNGFPYDGSNIGSTVQCRGEAHPYTVCVCVCGCVFFPFILDIMFGGRTSRGHTGGRSHRISPPSFCGASLNFSREKDSAIPFPRGLIILDSLGIFFLVF